MFQELFLVHFSPLIEWYNEQRSAALFSRSAYSGYKNNNDDDDDDDDRSVVSNTTTLLSTMSGDQAAVLKDLERDYSVLLEENCRLFVEYFKEVLVRNKVEDNGDQVVMIIPPAILLHRDPINGGDNKKVVDSDEDEIASQGFESKNRRYNVMFDFLEFIFYI